MTFYKCISIGEIQYDPVRSSMEAYFNRNKREFIKKPNLSTHKHFFISAISPLLISKPMYPDSHLH